MLIQIYNNNLENALKKLNLKMNTEGIINQIKFKESFKKQKDKTITLPQTIQDDETEDLDWEFLETQ